MTGKEELPAYFLEPTDAMLARISACLDDLPLNPEAEVEESQPDEKPRAGDKAQVLAALSAQLARDHAENMEEVGKVTWSFDYMVDEYGYDEPAIRGLSILTRLISPDPGDGKILYGSTVFRTGPERFLFWVE